MHANCSISRSDVSRWSPWRLTKVKTMKRSPSIGSSQMIVATVTKSPRTLDDRICAAELGTEDVEVKNEIR